MKKMRDSNLVLLGEHLRECRKSQGFSQESLADAAGIARAYYGCIERGERRFSILHILRIAKALNVEVGELFPSIKKIKDP